MPVEAVVVVEVESAVVVGPIPRVTDCERAFVDRVPPGTVLELVLPRVRVVVYGNIIVHVPVPAGMSVYGCIHGLWGSGVLIVLQSRQSRYASEHGFDHRPSREYSDATPGPARCHGRRPRRLSWTAGCRPVRSRHGRTVRDHPLIVLVVIELAQCGTGLPHSPQPQSALSRRATPSSQFVITGDVESGRVRLFWVSRGSVPVVARRSPMTPVGTWLGTCCCGG